LAQHFGSDIIGGLQKMEKRKIGFVFLK
jgi:hypothetical protein